MNRLTRDTESTQASTQATATTFNRPSARRLPSGAWGRLRSAPIDPLEAYGLPSKGETRLQDFKAQESYYKKIVERYMRFCARSGSGEKLEQAFASLTVDEKASSLLLGNNTSNDQESSEHEDAYRHNDPAKGPASAQAVTEAQKQELNMLLMAMRKLREAIVSTHRTDDFASRAYMFITHATILTRTWESYVPALSYLLRAIHPITPLSQTALNEVVGYVVLDLACRQREFNEAFALRAKYKLRDRRIDAVLRALVRDDWVLFWKVWRAVDGYRRALVGMAEDGVRIHALKCLGRSYLSVDRGFVEASANRSWEMLVVDGVGWTLDEDGEKVTIRKVKAR